MTADHAINWFNVEKANQWRLDRHDGEKVSGFEDSESVNEAATKLNDVVPLLPPGRYTLKAWKGKNKQASQTHFTFEVPNVRANAIASQSQASPEAIFEQARKLALEQFNAEQWKKDVDKRLDQIEEDLKVMAKSIKDLHNDDDDDDDNALDKITGVAERLPALTNGLNSLRGLITNR